MSAVQERVNLALFQSHSYHPGRSLLVQCAWFFVGLPLLRSAWIPSSSFRRWLLRLFGADIAQGVVIKPGVRVKFPWKLTAGRNCWIGEDAWIDNLAHVTLGRDVCLSQGVYLCTGNHDWSDPAFGLRIESIQIDDGAWVAARASLAPGVRIGTHAVVGLGAVVSANVPAYAVYTGNPACLQRWRSITPKDDSVSMPGGVACSS
ncbi:MAG: colanic acid biosynthesis acetyltransferase WcaF [Bryobacterales bacterium]|nr:colanic acid biosynthesis acetyltransferase WcaF [Bryobacterales bacterium]